MSKCVICGKPIPKNRENKDTCCDRHSWEKMVAWNRYIRKHKNLIMAVAINEYIESRNRPA